MQKNPNDIDFSVLNIAQELLNLKMLASLKMVTLVRVKECMTFAFMKVRMEVPIAKNENRYNNLPI